MDLEEQIKVEPVCLEEPPKTALGNSELVSEVLPLKQEIKLELTEPGPTEENTFEPSSDIKEEIFIEHHILDQLVPHIKEENYVENVEALSAHTEERPHRHTTSRMVFPHKCDNKNHMVINFVESGTYFDCNRTFRNGGSLRDHMTTHSTERPFRCGDCNVSFRHKNSLSVHISRHSGKRPYRCEHCNSTFNCKSAISRMVTHSRETPHQCLECGSSFSLPSTLRTNMLIHSAENLCRICARKFTHQEHLKRHMRTHCTDRRYLCERCSKIFTREYYLRNHICTYLCDVCNKSFSRQGHLKRHMATHSAERDKLRCADCLKAFTGRSSLLIHMKKHSKKNGFPCVKCNTSFTLKSSLHTHMVKHSRKPYVCTACDSTFTFKTSLRRHKLSHSAVDPFKK